MRSFWIMAVFLLAGIGMLVLAAGLHIKTVNFLSIAKKAEGQVVELVEKRSDKGGYSYAPRIRFKGSSGTDVFFVSSTSSNPASYSVGEVVTVLYDPKNDTQANIDSFFSLWGGELIAGLLGVIFTGIGGASVIMHIKQRRMYQWLERFGQTISARLLDVEKVSGGSTRRSRTGNRTLTASRRQRSYWLIRAQWQNPRDQIIYQFVSDAVYFDPSEYVKDTLNVRIDPENPKRYRIDIGFLPRMAD